MPTFIYPTGAEAVHQSTLHGTAGLGVFTEWDGAIEVSQCVDTGNGVERLDDSDSSEQDWVGPPFWTVYLHQREGGVAAVADFRTEAESAAFAAGIHTFRQWLQAHPDTTAGVADVLRSLLYAAVVQFPTFGTGQTASHYTRAVECLKAVSPV